MPSGLEINYFTEANTPENVHGLDEAIKQNNPAWFTTGKNGKPQINIINQGSPVRAQVLVHEMVHAITVDSIAQARKGDNPKAKESLDKLDALYEHIKAQVKADPNAPELMKYATQDVEEFVATGFSYPEFVNYLDNQLAPKQARGLNRIVTALRSFVDSILDVLRRRLGKAVTMLAIEKGDIEFVPLETVKGRSFGENVACIVTGKQIGRASCRERVLRLV